MSFWLLKADPDDYGWAELETAARATWDGVANNLAQKHMRAARKGDLALVYHTGDEKAVVGLAEIVSDPYPDPKEKGRVVFDLRPLERLACPVPLAVLRAEARFRDFPLVRMPRLSVMPVPAALWKRLLQLARHEA
jgi:predicted RNA-binding protein with PUA-like domain